MKLSTWQICKIEEQFDAESVPEAHPSLPSLEDAFGDHTFFLTEAGLNIVERDSVPGNSDARVVRLAAWSNEQQNELVVHQPVVLSTAVDLGSNGLESSS